MFKCYIFIVFCFIFLPIILFPNWPNEAVFVMQHIETIAHNAKFSQTLLPPRATVKVSSWRNVDWKEYMDLEKTWQSEILDLVTFQHPVYVELKNTHASLGFFQNKYVDNDTSIDELKNAVEIGLKGFRMLLNTISWWSYQAVRGNVLFKYRWWSGYILW